MEKSTDLGPQAISVVASVTAGMSSIIAAQLTKRFPLSFHESTPRWKYTMFPFFGYLLVYIGLVAYGIIRNDRLSGTLAFMAAPSVPLHGFLWALIPQTRLAADAPSTDRYIFQCFRRKPPALLVLTWAPLIAGITLAGVWKVWQGLAIQVATAVTFIATSSTPEPLLRARESAFGRAARYLLLPRPGKRDETIGYTVDLQRERLLDPVRIVMSGVDPYRIVSEQKCARLGPRADDETVSEVPIATYLDTFVNRFPLERLRDMTGRLWRSLEACKGGLNEPVMDIHLLYGLVERMAYVAYRPGSCSLDERRVAIRLNFLNCRADCRRNDAPDLRDAAQGLMAEWRGRGHELVNSIYWADAVARGSNLVDKPVPAADTLLLRLQSNERDANDLVASLGAVVSFFWHVFGHDQLMVSSIVQHVPFFHNRIWKDLAQQVGSVPIVCRGILWSMKTNSMLPESVVGHEWAAFSGDQLRWGGGSYALLDQGYARNSAVAYVAQLAIIVVKAVLEN